MKQPTSVARRFDPKTLTRARTVDTMLLPDYLSNILMQLSIAADNWRFHNGPAEDVQMGIDALLGVWTELEVRHSLPSKAETLISQ